MKNQILPSFQYQTKRKKVVGRGCESAILQMGKYAAKVTWFGDLDKKDPFNHFESLKDQIDKKYGWAREKAQHEFDIAKLLYEGGISVPKPYGVFTLNRDSMLGPISRDVPAFVMDYLPYPNLDFINDELGIDNKKRLDLMDRVHQELLKVKKLKIRPGEDAETPKNVLWSKKEDKIYLIDFSDWHTRKLVRNTPSDLGMMFAVAGPSKYKDWPI